MAEPVDPRSPAVLLQIAESALQAGNSDVADVLFRAASTSFEDAGDPGRAALVLTRVCTIAHKEGKLEHETTQWERAAVLFEAASQFEDAARCWGTASDLRQDAGMRALRDQDSETADEQFRLAAAGYACAGAPRLAANNVVRRCGLAHAQGRLDDELELVVHAANLYDQAGMPWDAARCWGTIASLRLGDPDVQGEPIANVLRPEVDECPADQPARRVSIGLALALAQRRFNTTDALETLAWTASVAREAGYAAGVGEAQLLTGVLLIAGKDHDSAIAAAREAVEAFAKVDLPRRAAAAAVNLGHILKFAGHQEEATRQLLAAAEACIAVGDRAEAGEALASASSVLEDMGEVADANAARMRALEHLPLDKVSRRSAVSFNVGKALHEQGDVAGAEPYARAAYDGFDSMGDAALTATAGVIFAMVLRSLGRDEDALEPLHRATAHFAAVGDERRWNQTIGELLSALRASDRSDEIVALLDDVIARQEQELARAGATPSERLGGFQRERAKALSTLGNHDEAFEGHRAAAATFAAAGAEDSAWRSRIDAATALQNGDKSQQAIDLLTEVLADLPDSIAPGVRADALFQFAAAQRNLENFAAALDPLTECVDLWTRASMPSNVALAHSERGRSLRALGQLEEAVKAHDAARALQTHAPDAEGAVAEPWPPRVVATNLFNRGLSLKELGRDADALEDFSLAAEHYAAAAQHQNQGSAHLEGARIAQRLSRAEQARVEFTAAQGAYGRAGEIWWRAIAAFECAQLHLARLELAEAHALFASAAVDYKSAGDGERSRKASISALEIELQFSLATAAETRARALIEDALAEQHVRHWVIGVVDLSKALLIDGRLVEAEEVLTAAHAQVEATHEPSLAQLLRLAALELGCTAGDPEAQAPKALALLSAEDLSLSDGYLARLRMVITQGLMWTDVEAAVLHGECALALAEAQGAHIMRIGAHHLLTLAYAIKGDLDAAFTHLSNSRAIADSEGDTVGAIMDSFILAVTLMTLERHAEAEDELRRTRARAEAAGTAFLVMRCDYLLALLLRNLRRLSDAEEIVVGMLERASDREGADMVGEILVLGADIADLDGRYTEALDRLDRAHGLFLSVADLESLADCEKDLAWTHLRLDQLDEATQWAEKSKQTRVTLGDSKHVADAQNLLGAIASRAGKADSAAAHYRAAAKEWLAAGDVDGVATAHRNLGWVLREESDFDATKAAEVLDLWVPPLLHAAEQRCRFTRPVDRERWTRTARWAQSRVFEVAVIAQDTETITDLVNVGINAGVFERPSDAEPDSPFVMDSYSRASAGHSIGRSAVLAGAVPPRQVHATTLSSTVAGIAEGTLPIAPPPPLIAPYGRPTLSRYRALAHEQLGVPNEGPGLAVW